ncbi:hypothetical protein, partial [Acidiphilium sp.]|uniref:hypothetical protein n=1 Tax=Acidiphilium sp. TaxID=527 RepID=UPI003D05DC32
PAYLHRPRPVRSRPARPRPARAARPQHPGPSFPPITSTPPPLGPGNHYFIPVPAIVKKSR